MYSLILDTNIKGKVGQFLQVGIEGLGEAPISISGFKPLQLSIRCVGSLTNKIKDLKPGDPITIRGPYGNGYPEPKKPLVIITGGCGIAPLKPLLKEADQVFMGFRSYEEMPFKKELTSLKTAKIALEQPRQGFEKGLLPDIIKGVPKDATIFICGPPIMIKFVLEKLHVPKQNIYISLERMMKCGFGLCGHCQIGNGKFVCKDGPVFRLTDLPNYE